MVIGPDGKPRFGTGAGISKEELKSAVRVKGAGMLSEMLGKIVESKPRKKPAAARKTVRAALRGSVPDGKLKGARITLAEDTSNSPIGGFTEYGKDRKTVIRIGGPVSDDAFGITVRGHETRHATRHTLARKKRDTYNAAMAAQLVDDVNIETGELPKVSKSGLEIYRRAHIATAMRDLKHMINDKRKQEKGLMPDTYEQRNARTLAAVRVKAMLAHYRKDLPYGRTHTQSAEGSAKLRKLIGDKMSKALHKIITLGKTRNGRERAISLLTMLLEDAPPAEMEEPEEKPKRDRDDEGILGPVTHGSTAEGHMEVIDLKPKSAYTAKEKKINMRYSPTGVHLNPTRFVSAIVAGDGKGLFSKRVRQKPGGTVVIDASGSMQPSIESLTALARKVPTATIAYYSGNEHAKGVLAIFANKGKRFDGMLPGNTLRGGNAVDLPAVRWLMDHPKPWTFVSDLQFTGGAIGSEIVAKALLERAEARGEVTIYRSLDGAYEAFSGGTETLSEAVSKMDRNPNNAPYYKMKAKEERREREAVKKTKK
jgi:hypothetical protein